MRVCVRVRFCVFVRARSQWGSRARERLCACLWGPRAHEHLFTCVCACARACAIVRVYVCMYERLCIYMYAWSLAFSVPFAF